MGDLRTRTPPDASGGHHYNNSLNCIADAIKKVNPVSKRLVYEFEGFRLDTASQSLISTVNEQHLSLKPKEFEVLLYLVERAGELLDKETLLRAFWPGQHIDENNLNQYITALRKILGEERGGRRFILNVRARGYRFVPEVLRIVPESYVEEVSHRAKTKPTDNPIAWQCFQHAASLRNEEHPDRWCEAIKLFERAIELDPHFAVAYAHLANTRILLFMLDYPGSEQMLALAEKEARLAVKLRPGSADAYMALGSMEAACGRWVEAELDFLASHKLDSEWILPVNMHSIKVLLSAGHIQRALEIGRKTLEDVEGVVSLANMQAVVCLLANRDEEASKAIQLALAMGAERYMTPMADALSLMAQRRRNFSGAVECLIPSFSSYLIAAGSDAVIRRVFEGIENPSIGDEVIAEVNEFIQRVKFEKLPQSACRQILLWYTQLNAIDHAYGFANKILDKYQRYGSIGTAWGSLWLREMKPFRADPRFTDFVTRMKLPDYWRAFGMPDGHVWKGERLMPLEFV